MNSGKIVVEWDRKKLKFRLTEDCVLRVARFSLSSEVTIDLRKLSSFSLSVEKEGIFTIPKGFLTDFGSIPAPFKPFFNPIGKEVPAYVLHDYLCSQSNKGNIKRITADMVFKMAVRDILNDSPYRITCLYLGVRAISLYRKLFPFKK